jgi:DMSO/TMAO reductase YedYZ molybdopterin-dependent catalytic subunit
VPDVDIATWTLELTGEVEQPTTLTFDQLLELPATEVTSDIHCVTRWSRFDAEFKGVHWRELAKLCHPKPSAHFVVAHAEHGFTANVLLEALEDENALIVYEADGEQLTPDHGYPVRLFIPTKYFWKSAKWLTGIELSSVDKPGFWERYGYHNNADFWQEQRYGF